MQLIENNPTFRPQAPGLGKEISDLYLILDFSENIFQKDRFILQIYFEFEGQSYKYARIFNTHQIDEKGLLDIGDIFVLGTYTQRSQLRDFEITLTYIDE